MDISFAFALNETVTIERNGLTGSIKGLYVEENGDKNYYVEYADRNGAIFQQYFKEHQIKKGE